MKTLEQILKEERERQKLYEKQNIYNYKIRLKIAKAIIITRLEIENIIDNKTTIYKLLKEYYENIDDTPFSKTMVLACWELINDLNFIKQN